MNKNVVWVTTFAGDMYRASGSALIDSFVRSKTCGRLVCGVEGVDAFSVVKGKPGTVQAFNLDGNDFLKEFLLANEDIIPTHLGGKHRFPECTCPGGPYSPHDKKHKMPCPGHWFNKNFSRWFRKIATMKQVVEDDPKVDALVWVDSDCTFTKQVSEKILFNAWFKLAYSCFYLKHKRPVMEAGVVGYWLPNSGRKLLDAVIGRYASGNFRKDPRWDDSYQIQMALADTKVPAVDLAYGVGEHSAVVPFSPIGPYITHDKGRHGRKLGIMT